MHDYNIKALDVAEQQLFVDCLVKRLYVGAKQRGELDGPVEFVVIDEADVFTCDDADHIINKTVKKTCKFGVGMVLVSKLLEQLSNDLLTSVSVKLLLRCPEMFLE